MSITLTTALEARAAWSTIAEPADLTAGRFTRDTGHETALEALAAGRGPLIDALCAAGISPELADRAADRWLPRYNPRHIEDALTLADHEGITLIDPATISGLSDLGDAAPHLLWARGTLDTLTGDLSDRISLTGSRACTEYGSAVTSAFASDLARRGVTVVSGGAYGIDAAAHRAALAVGGSTVAWMAGGVDRVIPSGHAQLLADVVEHGSAVVSELAPGASPTTWRFRARARLIAATTAATVIVEAGWRSGALDVADHAATLRRQIGAVSGPITSPASAGCHRLVRECGAYLITTSDEAYALLNR